VGQHRAGVVVEAGDVRAHVGVDQAGREPVRLRERDHVVVRAVHEIDAVADPRQVRRGIERARVESPQRRVGEWHRAGHGADPDEEQLAHARRYAGRQLVRDRDVAVARLHLRPPPGALDVAPPAGHERRRIGGRGLEVREEVLQHDRLVQRIAPLAAQAVAHHGGELGIAAEQHEAGDRVAVLGRRREREQRAERHREHDRLARRPARQRVQRADEVVLRALRRREREVVGHERRDHEVAGGREHATEPIEPRIVGARVVQPRRDQVRRAARAVDPHAHAVEILVAVGHGGRARGARPGTEPARERRDRPQHRAGCSTQEVRGADRTAFAVIEVAARQDASSPSPLTSA